MQGSANPSGTWTLDYGINGGSFTTGLQVNSAGEVIVPSGGGTSDAKLGFGSGSFGFYTFNNCIIATNANNGPALGASLLGLGQGSILKWGSSNDPTQSFDLGLARSAAGVVEVNNGTAGTYRDLKLRNIVQTGTTTTYNNVATAGNGFAAIVAAARVTAQSAANSSIASFTVGAADGSFEVSMNMNVTAATVLSTSLNCDYTDESNTARTMIFPTTSLSGSFLSGGLVTATGAFETPTMHIRCKTGTSIKLYTAAGTFSSVTYTAEGIVKQTQ